MVAEIIDGRAIAKKIISSVKSEVENLKIYPNITTVKIGSDPSSELYLKLRDKACAEVGIKSSHLELSEDISEEEVLKSIEKLNKDDSVHGILVQFPAPKQISQKKLINSIYPGKDVEGFNPVNMGKTLIGDEDLVPCTPKSVLTILDHEKIKLEGKDVVLINHSNVVGKPLTALFLNRNATVSVTHIFTKDIQKYTLNADIIVTATGVAKFLKKDHIKEGAVVIDVGIIKTDDGVCGDADFKEVSKKASKITPVPGGVGPVTIACCLQNMLKTYKNSRV